tara:strand:- start:4905 stop:5402 length:498 start_codon:yes stop_codon:yes gene_type:complete
MKVINIIGKNNVDKLINKNDTATRNKVNYEEPTHQEQIKLINKFYMNEKNNMDSDLIREIKLKLNSYKNQDIKKNIYNQDKLITIEEIIEKLVISKLSCYYCKKNVKILFVKVRDDYQWTLDRIDNSICHNNNNTVICCLKCNLERRIQNSNNFKFTKQLKIKKL